MTPSTPVSVPLPVATARSTVAFSATATSATAAPFSRALRRSHDPRSLPVAAGAQPVAVVAAHSLDRRARSRRLENLWTNQGDPDD